LVHKRVIDGEEMGAPGPHGIPLNNLSRLLICQSQAGCLIGKCAPRPERLCSRAPHTPAPAEARLDAQGRRHNKGDPRRVGRQPQNPDAGRAAALRPR